MQKEHFKKEYPKETESEKFERLMEEHKHNEEIKKESSL